jgi:hypothetical protein
MGIGDQILVEYKNKAYDFTSYFEDVKVYNTIDEIINKKEQLLLEVTK